MRNRTMFSTRWVVRRTDEMQGGPDGAAAKKKIFLAPFDCRRHSGYARLIATLFTPLNGTCDLSAIGAKARQVGDCGLVLEGIARYLPEGVVEDRLDRAAEEPCDLEASRRLGSYLPVSTTTCAILNGRSHVPQQPTNPFVHRRQRLA